MDAVIEIDPIDLIDRMLDEGEDIWEAAVTIGQMDEYDMAIRRWRQGDMVLRVQRQYGEGILSKYATALNVKTNTLKQRRTLSNFYTKDTRVSFSNVGYSHYREAMRLGNIDKALWALDKASTKDWPVWKFGLLLDRLLGKKAAAENVEGVIERTYSQDDGHYLVVKVQHMNGWQSGQSVAVKKKSG